MVKVQVKAMGWKSQAWEDGGEGVEGGANLWREAEASRDISSFRCGAALGNDTVWISNLNV